MTARIAALLAVALLAACASAPPSYTQVIVVRHAEKADDGGKDPELSARGQARARALADVVARAGVRAAFATQFRRTQATLAPLAEATGTPVVVVDAGDTAGLARRIREQHAGQVVVVAGHSNTVPAIVAALGGPTVPALAEDAYDDLFVVTLPSVGPTRVLHLRYAAPPVP